MTSDLSGFIDKDMRRGIIFLCSMSEFIYVVSKNQFACFNSFINISKVSTVCFNICCIQFLRVEEDKNIADLSPCNEYKSVSSCITL